MGAFCRLRIDAGLAGGSFDCDELCLQHVHSVGERISARALRIPARLGRLHSLFGPGGSARSRSAAMAASKPRTRANSASVIPIPAASPCAPSTIRIEPGSLRRDHHPTRPAIVRLERRSQS